jgi:hypothetical protein
MSISSWDAVTPDDPGTFSEEDWEKLNNSSPPSIAPPQKTYAQVLSEQPRKEKAGYHGF